MASKEYSIVEYTAEHEGYRCGYCKSPNTNYSHGLWAHTLTVQDYQDLIDRGWRRSGKYCYKPTLPLTCCPMYTIRCAALEVKLSKSQKKVLKRMQRFLTTGEMKSGPSTQRDADEHCDDQGGSQNDVSGDMDIPDMKIKARRAEQNLDDKVVLTVDPSLSKMIAPQISIIIKPLGSSCVGEWLLLWFSTVVISMLNWINNSAPIGGNDGHARR